MAREWFLTQEYFEILLDWLDIDREIAGQKYEAIRRRLIKIFRGRHCREPEELADQTINRVACKIQEIAPGYQGDPAAYFYGVAQNIYKEEWRSQKREVVAEVFPVYKPSVDGDADENALRLQCLKKCLAGLSADDREVVVAYYSFNQQTKIVDHRKLAERFALSLNNLRVRAFRIRQRLQKCVRKCLQKNN